jgi:hypothetical protein
VGQLEKETSMSNMYFEDHPTDPDKVILRKPRHEDDDDIQAYVKPWVGLTDEERNALLHLTVTHSAIDYAKAIEAKLKEKNA